MKLPNPAGLITVGKAFVSANRPELLFGTSIVTTVAAVVAAARGGYKSGYAIAEEDIKQQVVGGEKLNRKEIAQLTWLNYLPAAGITAGALGSTTGLHLVHVKEKKQLAAAALIAIDQVQKEATAYKKDVLDSVGLSPTEDPKDLDKASKKSGVAKIVHTDGEIEELYLVRDEFTGRDVYSNKHRIEEAIIDLNNQLVYGEAVDLNTFYSYAGYGNVPLGDDYGWQSGERVDVRWLDNTNRDDGRPVRPFTFRPAPSDNFNQVH